jgi:hypothetical protein
MAILDHIFDRAIPEPNSGCWLWDGAVISPKSLYGAVNLPGHRLAHRAVYAEAVEKIPRGMHVLHKCDVSFCVNPAHLFLGTHDDNMKDMARKGRSGVRKITPEQSVAIRNDPRTQREIAADYGISQSLVSLHKARGLA